MAKVYFYKNSIRLNIYDTYDIYLNKKDGNLSIYKKIDDRANKLLFTLSTVIDAELIDENMNPYTVYSIISDLIISHPINFVDRKIDIEDAFYLIRYLFSTNDNKFRTTKIVTICSSMKFKDDIKYLEEKLSMKGSIVLTPVIREITSEDELTDEEEYNLLKIHKEKIYMADMVFINNRDDYIGDNVKKEIEFAKLLNKKIRYRDDFMKGGRIYEKNNR